MNKGEVYNGCYEFSVKCVSRGGCELVSGEIPSI